MKLGIGIPLGTEWIPALFWFSYENLIKPEGYKLFTVAGALTPFAREKIVLRALEAECTHLCFIDSDMSFEPDALQRLIKSGEQFIVKKDIIAGLFFQRYDPYPPALSINDKQVIPSKLTEVDWVGMAFTLIDMNVFKKIPRPWFELDFNPKHIVSEDILFCIKAKKLGFKIWVDPEIHIGHLISVSIRKNQDNMLKIMRG